MREPDEADADATLAPDPEAVDEPDDDDDDGVGDRFRRLCFGLDLDFLLFFLERLRL